MKRLKKIAEKAICVDNSGYSASYGTIKDFLNLNDEVTIVSDQGGNYVIQTSNGEEYSLNRNRFKLI